MPLNEPGMTAVAIKKVRVNATKKTGRRITGKQLTRMTQKFNRGDKGLMSQWARRKVKKKGVRKFALGSVEGQKKVRYGKIGTSKTTTKTRASMELTAGKRKKAGLG